MNIDPRLNEEASGGGDNNHLGIQTIHHLGGNPNTPIPPGYPPDDDQRTQMATDVIYDV